MPQIIGEVNETHRHCHFNRQVDNRGVSGLPSTNLQLWVTSLPTVPAGAGMHRDHGQVNIAALPLRPAPKTHIAQRVDIGGEIRI